jgi:ferritin-like metal-binding protein YciE
MQRQAESARSVFRGLLREQQEAEEQLAQERQAAATERDALRRDLGELREAFQSLRQSTARAERGTSTAAPVTEIVRDVPAREITPAPRTETAVETVTTTEVTSPGTVEALVPTAGVPAEAGEASAEVVYAVARSESPRDRIVRYLRQAWSEENDQANALQTVANRAIDPDVRLAVEGYRSVVAGHLEAIEARLRELDASAPGGGFARGLLNWFGGAFGGGGGEPRQPDDFDQMLHDLARQYGTSQYKMASYHTLSAYARSAGDAESAALAERHLAAERTAAEGLWGQLAPLAVRLAQTTAV